MPARPGEAGAAGSLPPRPALSPDVSAPSDAQVGATSAEAVGRIARWLLLAMAADLLVSRLLVRLAMVVPKDGPVAAVAAVGGRIASVTDVLVAVVALLLVVALGIRAWHRASADAVIAILALGAVAACGIIGLRVAPTPTLMTLIGLAVVVAASAVSVEGWRAPTDVAGARLAIVLLAVAVGCAGLRTALGALGVGSAASGPGGSAAMLAATTGEASYVAGAMAIGLTGVAGAWRLGGAQRRQSMLLMASVTGAVLVAWGRAPGSWDALMIWSVGLIGVVPVPVIALTAGVSVAGLVALHRHEPRLAQGVGIALLGGSGLAASGLVLASLAGLCVATTADDARPAGSHR